MKGLLVAASLLVLFVGEAFSQHTQGKWSLGFHGGVNNWFNDFSTRKPGGGGELMLRYGVSRYFSFGVTGGYEALKSLQEPAPLNMNDNYMRLQAIPVAFNIWLHFAPGYVVSPYIYVGGGGMFYKRIDGKGTFIPNNKSVNTVLIPMGLGMEIFASRKVSLHLDFGFRITDDNTETIKYNKRDSWATAKGGINFYLGSGDADDDDKDGLTNGEERRFGTNSEMADSDGDGLKDGEEVKRYRTNPLSTDTDGDGLNDGEEVFTHKTNPAKSDSDDDGLSDGDEVKRYRTDPLRLDTDGDGMIDGDEVMKFGSDPLKVDTDSDGLSDWDEVKVYKTDPSKPDTDGDNLSDGDEVKKFKTDPLKADTDGGGVNDGIEIERNSNPRDPRDDVKKETIVLERGKSVILEGVNFASGSAVITRESDRILERAFEALAANPDIVVTIAGYTDNVGSAQLNENLSARRAQSVKAWLVKRGIAARRLHTVGKGMRDPIAPNDTLEGRAQNRRIEFHVQK